MKLGDPKPGDFVVRTSRTGNFVSLIYPVDPNLYIIDWIAPKSRRAFCKEFGSKKSQSFDLNSLRKATEEEIAKSVTDRIREPNELDGIGNMYRLVRAPGEDDEHFRKRLLVAASETAQAGSGIGYDVLRDTLLAGQ